MPRFFSRMLGPLGAVEILPSRYDRTRRESETGSRSWHSQITNTPHPVAWSFAISRLSRASLPESFVSQKRRRVSVTTPARAKSEGVRSDLVALELIRSSFDSFERSTSRIADQPVRTLRSSTASTDILRARRLDDRAIGNALRRGLSREATFAETLTAPRLVGALRGRWIPRVVETRREEGVDIYENRALLGFMRWLDATLSDMATRLADADLSDVNSSARQFYADRISRWRVRIMTLARRGLFAHLRSGSRTPCD
jgi:hypothetical protein